MKLFIFSGFKNFEPKDYYVVAADVALAQKAVESIPGFHITVIVPKDDELVILTTEARPS